MAPTVPVLTVVDLERQLKQPGKPFVLDVREPWEFAQGHVPDAQLVPLGELELRIGEVPRDRPVAVVCQSGQRSLAAAAYLIARGYREVANVDGGTTAWVKQGFPISR
ncbi:MAG TPA: rhodanese-like domain-containing protein [Candidatus Dormibacteraeota bacterium]|jgi:rhodanese-related sulfurtransferase|nr:rhodanese-like domain-containing protein [Candidatus Dormibacteraeota bacterium]